MPPQSVQRQANLMLAEQIQQLLLGSLMPGPQQLLCANLLMGKTPPITPGTSLPTSLAPPHLPCIPLPKKRRQQQQHSPAKSSPSASSSTSVPSASTGGQPEPTDEPEYVINPATGKRVRRNYKNMTSERRKEANARERSRVHTIGALHFFSLVKIYTFLLEFCLLQALHLTNCAASYHRSATFLMRSLLRYPVCDQIWIRFD